MGRVLHCGAVLSFGFIMSSLVAADPVQRAGTLGIAYFEALTPSMESWSAITTADLNGDGHLDVVGRGSEGTQIGIILSTPAGYAPAITQSLCNCFADAYPPVAIGDLNGDGTLEVLVADETGRRVWSVPFVGGKFGNGAWVSTSDVVPSRFAAEAMPDLDGDGRDDMIFSSSGSLSVIMSASPGTILTRQTGINNYDGLTDLTGDGVLDMVAAGNELVRVFPGGPQGFGEVVEIIVPPGRVSVVDLDGDGHEDLIGSDDALGEGWIRRNEGGGVFGPERRFPAIGLFDSLVNVGDLDGSGLPDVVGYIKPPGFFLGDAHIWHDPWTGGGFEDVALIGLAPTKYVSRDLDGDGRLDLMAIRMQNITGMLNCRATRPVVGTRTIPIDVDPLDIRAADFDHDGVPELIVCDFDGITVLHREADGGYQGQRLDSGVGVRFMSMPTDIDGDGSIDLVVSAQSDGIEIWPGSADGLGQPPIRYPFDAPSSLWQLARGDVTGDGVDDVVTPDFAAGLVRVLIGVGGGMPTEVDSIALESAKAVGIVDVDGDGVGEIVAAGGPGNVLRVFHRDQDGWDARAEFQMPSRPYWITCGDLDGDGWGDVVVGFDLNTAPSLKVIYGSQDGLMAPVDIPVQPRGHSEIIMRDVNNDGHADLVVSPVSGGSNRDGMARILIQSEPRVFLDGGSLPGQRAGGVDVADLDGDDILEIFGVSNNGSTDLIQIHANRALPCSADITGDGQLNFFDIHAFVGYFIAQDPRADIAAPFGAFNFFDVQAYMTSFGLGCP